MSKPIARVVFSVLIALVLVVGIFTSVQGARLNAGTKSGQAHVNLSLRHDQASTRELGSFGSQADTYDKSGHGCDSESWVDPDD